MSLSFRAGPSYVNHGSNNYLDNLSDITLMWWLYPIIDSAANRRLLFKGTGIDAVEVFVGTVFDSQQMYYYRGRATTASEAVSAAATYLSNSWQFWAVADSPGVAPAMYRGSAIAKLSEIAYYVGYPITGVGAPLDESGFDLLAGGRAAGTTNSDAIIAWFSVYNRRLSYPEIEMHRGKPSTKLAGCVLQTYYGKNGSTGLQPDESGCGNHGLNTSAVLTGNELQSPVLYPYTTAVRRWMHSFNPEAPAPGGGPTFNAAWAKQSNNLIGGGVW